MTKERMTVHKALAELKLLDNRIAVAITDGVYCVANKNSNEKIAGVTVQEYTETMQGRYDKATNLIKRRNAIKRAIVLSNATTMVSVCGCGFECTVAEAIEMKNHGIEFDKRLYDALRKSYNQAQKTINNENADLEERANQYVTAIYGQKESKTSTSDIQKVKDDFIESNQYVLVDPLNVLEKLDSLERRISDFEAEVDAALSTSNALTEIEIEY